MPTITPYLKDKRKNPTPVVLYMYLPGGVVVRLKTGESVNPALWSSRKRAMKPSAREEGKRINARIEELTHRAREAYYRAERKGELTKDRVRYEYQNFEIKKESLSFLDVFDRYLKFKETEGVKPQTIRRWRTTRNHLEVFQTDHFFNLSFEAIDNDFFRLFKGYLESCGQASATVHRHFKTFKGFMKWARKNKFHTTFAWEDFTVKYKHEKREALTEEEYQRLKTETLPPTLDRARDLFVFMAETGMRFGDMYKFNSSHELRSLGGVQYLEYETQKTGKLVTGARVTPKIIEILEKYQYELPVISNQKLNDRLHELERVLELNKPLTCHIARHTFITLSIERGMSPAQVRVYTAQTLGVLEGYWHQSAAHNLKLTAD